MTGVEKVRTGGCHRLGKLDKTYCTFQRILAMAKYETPLKGISFMSNLLKMPFETILLLCSEAKLLTVI